MDFEEYKQKYYANPRPEPRFEFSAIEGVSLYFDKYQAAVEYYHAVLGPPAYIEGEDTRGWRIGASWLTLFPAEGGGPQNVEITFVLTSPAEAERLQAAFIAAGGQGDAPSDQLRYKPIRMCPVQDPFGTNILITSPLTPTPRP